MRNWKKNAKLAGVSFKRLPVSAENNGNRAQTWNPGMISLWNPDYSKYVEAKVLLNDLTAAQGFEKDRFYVAKGGGDSALIYTFSQWMYWFKNIE